MLLFGIGCFILCFTLYLLDRLLGDLPSQSEWIRMLESMEPTMRPNHGPWHAGLGSFLVTYPPLVLTPSTLAIGILLSLYKRRIILLVHSFAICFVISIVGIFQFSFFAWAID